MANEISVSAIVVELEDGTYRATCPDLGIDSAGPNADDAVHNLKEAVVRRVKEVGPDRLQLNPVKCMKVKVQLD